VKKYSFLYPLDQPLGKRRLLEDLKKSLADKDFSEFYFTVAFAKVGPLYRLQELLQAWRAAGKNTMGIFGIDHCGTSVQALQFALDHLDSVYYTQYRGHSFHPKVYCFKGKKKAVVFIGSNNLTMGGMEINFEAAIEIEFSLPDEHTEFEQARTMFTSLLPQNCSASHILTADALANLVTKGLLLDETKKNVDTAWNRKLQIAHPSEERLLPVKPMSRLPSHIFFGKGSTKQDLAKKAETIKVQAEVVDVTKTLVPVNGFAIQIKPHHNGEIFLSKTAAQQNPAFFGMPFTGQTIPKKGTNVGYPQRTPDPVCNIVVFGAKNTILYSTLKYSLNTVFYTTKSEIRVTASHLVPHVPEYSVLLMMPSKDSDVDYEMQIFTPKSPDYAKWLTICDQKMPGGGKEPRRFGWF
jgi:HKD family nuclease